MGPMPMAAPSMPMEPPMPPPQAGDSSKVEKVLLKWSYENLQYARKSSQTAWDECDACLLAYRGSQKLPNAKDSADQLDYKIDVPILPDQIDDVVAILMEVLSGDLFRLQAKNGEEQFKADLMKSVALAEMSYRKKYRPEIAVAAARFVKYPLAGLKSCRGYECGEETQTHTLPGEAYNDNALQASGQDFQGAMQQAGYKPMGTSAPEPTMGLDGNHVYPDIYAQKTVPYEKSCFYIEAFDPRKVAWSDPMRPLSEQFTVHEFRYLTRDDMELWKEVQNLDQLGTPENNNPYEVPNPTANLTQLSVESSPRTNPNFSIYEIAESWQKPPFKKWLGNAEGGTAPEDYDAFALKFGIDPSEFDKVQWWCFFHSKDKALLKGYPNYLFNKMKHPYNSTSYFPAERGIKGQSLSQRLSDFAAALYTFVNLYTDNLRLLTYGSLAVADNTGLNDPQELLARLNQPKGIAVVKGNRPLADMLQWREVYDATGPALNGIGFFKNSIEGFGVPPAMTGEAHANTATQDSINQNRGQTRINAPLRRFVEEAVLPAVEDVILMIFANFTTPQYVDILGENGELMGQNKYITPMDITSKFEIEPVGSFDIMDEQNKSNLLLGLIKVIGPFIAMGQMPPQLGKIVEMILEKNRFSISEIDEVMNSVGTHTNVMQEIAYMAQAPTNDPEVRPDDPHAMCIQMVQMAIQNGQLDPNAPNVQKYLMAHQGLLAQQQMMAQQQAAMQPQQGGQGAPHQPQNTIGQKHDQNTSARQGGQNVSPPDQGTQTAAGMTGTAGLGAM